jgi:hypothetical protein
MSKEIAMLRALEVNVLGVGIARRLAVLGLLAVGGAFAPLVARRKANTRKPELVEVSRLEVGGARYGAVYEDGRLVGIVEGIDRL